ncbi:MAG: 4Fe-4S binding protein [Adlercreutzia sp.]|nr:4Fe-4S binding protein [Adlercreutzia sp.]
MTRQRWRTLCVLLVVIALPVAGLLFPLGTGTLSALGIDSVAALCPVGALEAMLGAKSVVLHGIVCLGITVLLVIALGKALCAWACPVPWLQKFFRGKKDAGAARAHDEQGAREGHGASGTLPAKDIAAVAGPGQACAGGCQSCGAHRGSSRADASAPLPPAGGKRDGLQIDGRHVVLAGALGSSALFGFPVFCLVCPIGLTFATLIGLWQLFSLNETSWGLVLFPLILLLEVTVLRKWCTKICPVSALLSLVASANRLFRPSVAKEACLRERGIDCTVCVDVCPEQVDPHSSLIPECSKCGQCADACPAHAISFPVWRPRGSSATEPIGGDLWDEPVRD